MGCPVTGFHRRICSVTGGAGEDLAVLAEPTAETLAGNGFPAAAAAVSAGCAGRVAVSAD